MNTQKMTKETEVSVIDFDFQPVQSKQSYRGAGAVSIVNTVKHGRRISMSTELFEHLNKPDSVNIAVNKTGIAIGTALPGKHNRFNVRPRGGNAGVIYAGPLVEEITAFFELDFSNCTSISFPDVKFVDASEQYEAYAIVTLLK